MKNEAHLLYHMDLRQIFFAFSLFKVIEISTTLSSPLFFISTTPEICLKIPLPCLKVRLIFQTHPQLLQVELAHLYRHYQLSISAIIIFKPSNLSSFLYLFIICFCLNFLLVKRDKFYI